MGKAEAAGMRAGVAPRAARLPHLGQKRIFASMSISRQEAEHHSLCFPTQGEEAGERDEGSEVSSENLPHADGKMQGVLDMLLQRSRVALGISDIK